MNGEYQKLDKKVYQDSYLDALVLKGEFENKNQSEQQKSHFRSKKNHKTR